MSQQIIGLFQLHIDRADDAVPAIEHMEFGECLGATLFQKSTFYIA
jgi:hypothetical protein